MNRIEIYALQKDVKEDLANAYANGYMEIVTMRPADVLDDLIDCSGRDYSTLSLIEKQFALQAIIEWQTAVKRDFFRPQP